VLNEISRFVCSRRTERVSSEVFSSTWDGNDGNTHIADHDELAREQVAQRDDDWRSSHNLERVGGVVQQEEAVPGSPMPSDREQHLISTAVLSMAPDI